MQPICDRRFPGIRGKTASLLPISRSRQLRKKRAAFSKSGACRGSKGNHGFSGEIVAFYEAVHRPRRDLPPKGLADEYGIVAFPVLRRHGNQLDRSVFGMLMLIDDAAAVIVVVQVVLRIGIRRHEFK